MKSVFAAIVMIFAATVAMAQTYQLRPGDVVSIEVLEDPSLNRQTFVLPDGTITFPLAGTVRAAGRSVSQVQANLATALEPSFAVRPTVFVAIQQLAGQDEAPQPEAVELLNVYFTGEVNGPGLKQVRPGTDILQFIASTGGFTRFAALKRLQLRRTDAHGVTRTYLINYRAIERGAAITNNFTVQDGDVLIAPTRRLFE